MKLHYNVKAAWKLLGLFIALNFSRFFGSKFVVFLANIWGISKPKFLPEFINAISRIIFLTVATLVISIILYYLYKGTLKIVKRMTK